MEKKKILVVDDEADLITFVKARLEINNYEVLTATDGEEAMREMEKTKPDLVILDILLPKLDGYRVCELMKKDQRYAHIPIIMLTAKDQKSDILLAKKIGADAYITKPFESDLLLFDIKKFLERKTV